ncbi:MAG: glycosyl transferase [Fibrobacteraceae bacterium]
MATKAKKAPAKKTLRFGYFDDANKEYVLTTPATPIKWCNYVGTMEFGGIVDTTGGSLICKGDPALNRITKYIAQMPSSDFKASTIFIRVKNGKGYKVFSPFVTPTLTKMDKWECHIGLSYSRWIAEVDGLRVQVTIFVPTKSHTLLQDIQVTNLGGAAKEVDIIPVYEFSHFEAEKQLTNADWVPQTMTLKAHPEKDGHLVLEQYAYMKRDYAVNYVTADGKVSSFEGDRRVFLGMNEMGSWISPLSLENKEFSNSECDRGDNVAALMIHAGKISAKKTFRTCTQLGQEQSVKAAAPAIKKYRDLKNVDKAFAELADFWAEYLQAIQVNTPDASFNSMVNVHNPRQCHTTKNWSRYLSLYQLGYGTSRGIGYRDSSQDLLGVMSHMPEEALELTKNLLSVQRPEGNAMHQYLPGRLASDSGDEANEGDSREKAADGYYNWYGDDHLWIVLTVAGYLKETGKLDFLKEQIPFYEKGKTRAERKKGTVLDHLQRSLKFTREHLGQHGLPLLGFADWNDTMNLAPGAESTFNASLYGKALLEMMAICEATGDKANLDLYKVWYKDVKDALNKNTWDGQWWTRWFDKDGVGYGSSKQKYGKIHCNGQSWPVISGLADGERAKKALDSVNKYLNTSNGIKLSWPGYKGFDPQVGGISTYPPGAKENGGIFLHANPWVMIAETIIGRGDRAFEYYNQINPAAKNTKLEEFESEPYCYPQNILGDEHKMFGMGRNAWLSGTSSWTYQAATQYILGIRANFDGLVVDPCIPANWKGFEATRRFRGATYQITVKNPKGICKGVEKMVVDGKEIDSNVAPIFTKGVHSVEVTLG